ncbi:MAG: hypothetical protein K9G38_03395 [Bacteroidales bacterium]|nr:hypothetical protein [Bacteroidales bacterium]
MFYVLVLLTIFLLYILAEGLTARRSRNQIKYRIHVNGTRGKSTVVHYITILLRHNGINAYGKVTGEIPSIICPNGHIQPIKRRGPARITEQFNITRKVAREKGEALVLECMSIDPELQKMETGFFKPDIYVVTNIKDDHREKLGSDIRNQVIQFVSSVPKDCKLILPDTKNLQPLKRVAQSGGGCWFSPPPLSVDIAKHLPFSIFGENIELASEVVHHLIGTRREENINTLINVVKSKEKIISFDLNNNQVFLNGFSVNDPESATVFLNEWMSRNKISGKAGVVLNTRADRPLRTQSFISWIHDLGSRFRTVIVTGDHMNYAFRKLKKVSHDHNFELVREKSARKIISMVREREKDLELIMGIANLKGNGSEIIEFIKTQDDH